MPSQDALPADFGLDDFVAVFRHRLQVLARRIQIDYTDLPVAEIAVPQIANVSFVIDLEDARRDIVRHPGAPGR